MLVAALIVGAYCLVALMVSLLIGGVIRHADRQQAQMHRQYARIPRRPLDTIR